MQGDRLLFVVDHTMLGIGNCGTDCPERARRKHNGTTSDVGHQFSEIWGSSGLGLGSGQAQRMPMFNTGCCWNKDEKAFLAMSLAPARSHFGR